MGVSLTPLSPAVKSARMNDCYVAMFVGLDKNI